MARHENNDVDDYTLTIKAKPLGKKAFMVENLDGKDVWLPYSQCTTNGDWDEVERGDTIVITIPDWLAEKNGLR